MSGHFVMGGALTFFVIGLHNDYWLQAAICLILVALWGIAYFTIGKWLIKLGLIAVFPSTIELVLYAVVALVSALNYSVSVLFIVLGCVSLFTQYRRFRIHRPQWHFAMVTELQRKTQSVSSPHERI